MILLGLPDGVQDIQLNLSDEQWLNFMSLILHWTYLELKLVIVIVTSNANLTMCLIFLLVYLILTYTQFWPMKSNGESIEKISGKVFVTQWQVTRIWSRKRVWVQRKKGGNSLGVLKLFYILLVMVVIRIHELKLIEQFIKRRRRKWRRKREGREMSIPCAYFKKCCHQYV